MTLREDIALLLVSYGAASVDFDIAIPTPKPDYLVYELADRILALLAESGWRHVADDCVVVPRSLVDAVLEEWFNDR